MWIDDIDDEALRTWIRHSPNMQLVSSINGEIVWANEAFCEWSQYTLNELKRLTWMQISVQDKDLEADIEAAKSLTPYNPIYTIKKQYVPKGSKPEWGHLTVMRYPLQGEIQFCLCAWEPLKNGTAIAFSMAMEKFIEVDKRLKEMSTEISSLTSQTDEDKFVLGGIRMIKRYPKVAAGLLVVMLSLFGLNNILEILQRTGFVQLPTSSVKMDKVE
jgi:hypothetical protein